MNETDLELSIIDAIVTAERESLVTFTPEQRKVFRIGFVFGADWYQRRISRAVTDAKEGA